MKNRFEKILLAAALAAFFGCESDLARKPIDARTRARIDSLATAEIRKNRDQIDSFYDQNRPALLKKMMDSLVVVRRREIDEQIKSAQKGQ